MKYIKLFEHTYSTYDLITMPEYQAGELLFDEIAKSSPDLQFINDLLEYSKVFVNWQDDWGVTALMWASWKGHTEIVKLLLERPEIDVNLENKRGQTALMNASAYGRTEIANLIKDHLNSKKTL